MAIMFDGEGNKVLGPVDSGKVGLTYGGMVCCGEESRTLEAVSWRVGKV
jgi:hypothetical protein